MFVSNNYGPAIRLQVLVLLWAPLIENRGIRAAALRLLLETFTELLRFFLKLWLPPDVFAFRAEALPWYGNAFSMLRALQATPNRTMRIYLITSECLYYSRKMNDEHFSRSRCKQSANLYAEVQRCTHSTTPLVRIYALGTSDQESRDPGRSAANCAPSIRRASSLSSSDVSEHFHKTGRSCSSEVSSGPYFDLSYSNGCPQWNRPSHISVLSLCSINRKTSRLEMTP